VTSIRCKTWLALPRRAGLWSYGALQENEQLASAVFPWNIMAAADLADCCAAFHQQSSVLRSVVLPSDRCGHHVLLAHAKAAQLYRQKYQAAQRGQLSFSTLVTWPEPASTSPQDARAAQNKLDAEVGWWLDPVYFGDYPGWLVGGLHVVHLWHSDVICCMRFISNIFAVALLSIDIKQPADSLCKAYRFWGNSTQISNGFVRHVSARHRAV